MEIYGKMHYASKFLQFISIQNWWPSQKSLNDYHITGVGTEYRGHLVMSSKGCKENLLIHYLILIYFSIALILLNCTPKCKILCITH